MTCVESPKLYPKLHTCTCTCILFIAEHVTYSQSHTCTCIYLESRYVIGCVYIYIHTCSLYMYMNCCTMNVHVLCTLCSNTVCADIALLVLKKCKNFEMLFDYEFVEDFYVDRDKSPRQQSRQRRTGTTNALVSGRGGGSVESLPGSGKGEEGKKAEVELKEVRVVTGDENKETKVLEKRSAAEDTSHSPTSDATSDELP